MEDQRVGCACALELCLQFAAFSCVSMYLRVCVHGHFSVRCLRSCMVVCCAVLWLLFAVFCAFIRFVLLCILD